MQTESEATTEVSAPEKNPKPEGMLTSDLKTEYMYHIGHADDYSWVTGQLYYVHAAGGLWVVRYATVDTDDKYGGSVVLAPAVNMKNFREGDLVSVAGGIADDSRASKNLGGPSYQATHVELIERADR
jgi:hypothetical protein